MIKYNIEIKYILNDIEETRNMYYKSVNVLNAEQQEEVIQDFINSLKSFYGVSTILETHIWEHGKDKEKINLNKLKNYKSISYATAMAQLGKVKEEYHVAIMPCFRSLTLEKCPKLEALPDSLLRMTQLQTLCIYVCPALKKDL